MSRLVDKGHKNKVLILEYSNLKLIGFKVRLQVDLKCENNSHVTKQSVDPFLNQQMLKEHARFYVGNKMKEADPSGYTFKKFPPVFLLVGTDEVLNDDSKNFYAYIKNIQPKSKFKEYPGQKHVWPVSNINSDESKEAIKDINEFIKQN